MTESPSISKELIVADKEAKMTEIKNKNMKNEIMRIKKRLETAFDLETITKLENDIKVCEEQILELNDQTEQILKVSKNQ